MKQLLINLSVVFFIAFISCKKNKAIITEPNTPVVEDPRNHSLLNKPLEQIKSEIAGRWQVKRTYRYACGVAGCISKDSIYANNTGDLISFLSNDTVRQMDYTQVYTKIYDKANITKRASGYGTYNGFPWNVDSVYVYSFPNFIFNSFSMIEIKNDTLVTYGTDFKTFYLIRKP